MILAGLFTPWWIILAAPTGRCFLSWTSSTVHSHRAAPEAHRPFPPVSPRPPRTFHDLSLFFIPFPPPMLLRRSSSRFERCALRSRLSLIARWKFRFASLRNCDPLNRAAAPLSLSLSVRGLLFYHLSLLVSFTKRGTYILVSCLLLAIDRGRITRPVVDPSIAREFSIQDSWFLSSIYSNRLIINSEKTRAWLH